MKLLASRFALPLAGIVLLILFFSLLPTSEGTPVRHFFLTVDNFKFIAAQTAVVAIATLGMTLIIASGGIDLSAGAVLSLASVASALFLQHGHSAWLAILAAILIGIGTGAINGGLITYYRISPWIITLGMAGIANGVGQWLAQDQPVPVPSTWLGSLMAPFSQWFWVAPGVWITLLLAIGMAILFRNTVFGRHLFAIGSGEEAARLCGVRVPFIRVWAYAAGGALFGLAGLLQMARLREASPSILGLTLDILAAAAIGGVRLGKGGGSILGAIFGAFLVTLLRNGCQQAGWNPAIQNIAVGAALVLAVAIQQLRDEPPLRTHASAH